MTTPNSEDEIARIIKSRLRIRLTRRKPSSWEGQSKPTVEVALLWSSAGGESVIDRASYVEDSDN